MIVRRAGGSRLLALDEVVGLQGAPAADTVLEAAAGRVPGEASLTGTYRRG